MNDWRDNPEYLKMLSCYQLAGLLEHEGRIQEANEYYDKGLQIQLDQPKNRLTSGITAENRQP